MNLLFAIGNNLQETSQWTLLDHFTFAYAQRAISLALCGACQGRVAYAQPEAQYEQDETAEVPTHVETTAGDIAAAILQ